MHCQSASRVALLHTDFTHTMDSVYAPVIRGIACKIHKLSTTRSGPLPASPRGLAPIVAARDPDDFEDARRRSAAGTPQIKQKSPASRQGVSRRTSATIYVRDCTFGMVLVTGLC